MRLSIMFCPKSKSQGQVLIDIVVATGVFMILIHAIFSITVSIYETIGYSKTRTIARHLASEKMELLKNLPYNNLGTTTGIPNGIIPEFETLNRNGLNYYIHTTIAYIDDPYDQISPQDLLPTDYKTVRVSVSWEGIFNSKSSPITLVSNISPKGIENTTGGGTLSIFVIDGLAKPVSQAQIHITNSQITPIINMTLQTNQEGRVILPGAPTCATCYNIEVTKTNYTSDKTYTTTEVANPDKRPVTIQEGFVSEPVFIIDKTSKLIIYSHYPREQNFQIYPSSTFRITGTKTIGTDVDGDPIYKTDNIITTNSNGNYTFNNLDWDTYIITIPSEESKALTGIYPHQPFSINPNQELSLNYSIITKPENSLLLSITNASSSAIASVSAILNKTGFIATKSSGLENNPDFGQVFFNDLSLSEYSFTLSVPNYNKTTGIININKNTVDTVIMQN